MQYVIGLMDGKKVITRNKSRLDLYCANGILSWVDVQGNGVSGRWIRACQDEVRDKIPTFGAPPMVGTHTNPQYMLMDLHYQWASQGFTVEDEDKYWLFTLFHGKELYGTTKAFPDCPKVRAMIGSLDA